MKIFLTVTAVILGILLLLFLLIFFLTVKLCFEYDTDTGKISLYIKALFIKYTVLPQDPAKARKKALKKQKKKENDLKKKLSEKHKKELSFTDEELKKLEADAKGASEAKDEKEKVPFSERIKHFIELIGSFIAKIKVLAPAILSAIKLEIKRLDVVVGGDDAANAAISYGAVCAAIDALYAVGKNTKKLKVSDKVFVAVDYSGEKFRADMAIALHVRVAKLIIPALKVLFM